MDRIIFLKKGSQRVALLAALMLSAGCTPASVTSPNTPAQPSSTSSPNVTASPSGPNTPDNPHLSPLPPSPVASDGALPGGTCSPLASVTGVTANTTVKGYVPLATTLSCTNSVASLQYMYRYLPTGELTPIGGNQTALNYRFDLNTSILTDGNYELVSKVTLTNGQVLFSAPLKLQIANSVSSTGLGGGGGGGGGGSPGGGTASPSPDPSPSSGGGGTGQGNLQIPLASLHTLVTPGARRWSLDLGQDMSSTPVIAANGDIMFAADNDFYVYAPNGQKKKEISLPVGAKVSSVVLAGNNAYLLDQSNGSLHLVDRFNQPGGPLYNGAIAVAPSGLFEFNMPAVDCAGNVYVVSRNNNRLYKINGYTVDSTFTDGLGLPGIKFLSPDNAPVRYASPVIDVDNNRLYVGSQQGLHMVNLATNAVATFDPGLGGKNCTSLGCNDTLTGDKNARAINSPLAVDQSGNVYATSESGTLYKLSPNGGQLTDVDHIYVGDGDNAPVIGSDGTVYVASEDGRLRAFQSNGQGKFVNPPGWPATGVGLGNVVEFSSPVIGEGPTGDIIYVGTEAGLVWSINGTNSTAPSHAKVIQELEAPIRGSLTLSNDGTLYVSTLDGRVFGVLTESKGLAPNAHWARAQGNNNGTGTFKVGALGGTDGCSR